MTTSLAPSQQAVCHAIELAWPHHRLFHLWCYRGCGRTVMVDELHQRLGGVRLSMREVVAEQIGRHPSALEDTLYCVVRQAFTRADAVLIDDWHLLADVVSGCNNHTRAGFLEGTAAAIADLAAAQNKRLLIASDSSLPHHLAIRSFPQGLGELAEEDYQHLCGELGGPPALELDVAQIHRFAPRLNGYQLRDACAHFLRVGEWSTESFIDYLREHELVSNVRRAEVAPACLEDLVGVDDVVDSLVKYIVFPLENETLALQLDLKPKRGVLLLGLPGTGKTSIGKALAHRLMGKFFLIDGTVISGTQHFYHHIAAIFQAARDNAPSVIFIDDSDVIFENQQEHGLYRYLLTMLDGLEGQSNGRVCVMLTAMELQHIPPALMRSGRVELWLQMRYPDEEARSELLRRLTAAMPAEIPPLDRAVAATATQGCSGADLKRLVNDAKTLLAWDRQRAKAEASFTDYFLSSVAMFREQRADYQAAEERGRRQRANRPVWFDVPTDGRTVNSATDSSDGA